jgi:hypothetical protein
MKERKKERKKEIKKRQQAYFRENSKSEFLEVFINRLWLLDVREKFTNEYPTYRCSFQQIEA